MKPLFTALAVAAVLLHTAVFVLFLVDDHRLGGDALNGGQADGKYWVSDHGQRTEVTAEEFRRNRALAIAVFAGTPVAMAALGYLLFSRAFPWFLYPRGVEDLARGVKRVRESGAAVAAARIGGSLGRMNFGGPMLAVSIHPGGMVVKPLWMEPFALQREHVVSVARTRILLARRLRIEHRSPDVKSPILLEMGRDPAFAAAVEGLSPGADRPSDRAPGRPPSGRSGRP